MKKLLAGGSPIAIILASSMVPAAAQVDKIIVTATKREESSQDIPVAVNALGEESLNQLGVDVFTDYLVELPGVTAGGTGPGQNTIYIRGVASTTPNLTTAGVAGLAPNVAFYLDEQPLAQPGRNLDVYAADLQRVEVLPGPQGTLFGASSQAGTVRLITNQPKLGVFEASASAATAFTEGGEMSNKVEAVLNVPVGQDLALRGVVFTDRQGGYIDNVAGQITARESARFRPEGTVRPNGVPVSAFRAGFQADADLSDVTFLTADNSSLTEEDFNDVTYAGGRLSGLYEINEDWRVRLSHMRQSVQSDGVFFDDPELDDFEVQRYEQDRLEDEFHNTSWTVEGQIGVLEALYTGAYTDRDTEQRVDYTDYLFIGQYLPYYICDGSVSYPGDADPSGTCQAPNLAVTSDSQTEIQTHELRFTTPSDLRVSAVFGGFYSDLELIERNDFTYFGSENVDLFGGSFPDNFPFPGSFQSDPGPFPDGVIFRNDVRRTDEQVGIFGEVKFDIIPDRLAIRGGARWYDIEVDLEGTANASFCNSSGTDENAFGTNISDLYDGDGSYTFIGSCSEDLRQTFTLENSLEDIQAAGLSAGQAQQVFNAVRAPDVAATDGVVYKGTVEFTPSPDLLFFATYSEGFRPGLLNRPGGAQGPNGFTVPFALDTDDLKNYELGWKMELFANQLRFNGSIFYNEIERLQTTIFDPSITNLFFSDNAADAEVKGIEGDLTYAPIAMDGLTVSGAFSILDTEITEVLTPTGDVREGDSLAFAPEFQGNIRARYEWAVGDKTAHVQPQIVYSSEAFTDIITINRTKLDSWTTLGLRTGISGDRWMAEIFGENLTNERAELSGNFVNDRERIVPMRPRTVGMRFTVTY